MPSHLSDQICSAFEHLPHGVFLEDPEGELLYVNPAGWRMFQSLCDLRLAGVPLDKAMAAHIRKLLPDTEEDIIDELVEQGIQSRKDGISQDLPAEDGRNVRLSQAKLQSGHIVTIATDIHDLIVQKQELERARTDANAASRAKAQFLSTMSHEIRTPLNGVMGMAQALSNMKLAGPPEEMVALLLQSSRQLSNLLNAVLEASTVDRGEVDIVPTYNCFQGFIEDVFERNRSRAEEKDLWYKLILPPHVPQQVKFDATRLRQCIESLISNAIKFTNKGGIAVVVDCAPVAGRENQHQFDIHVQDTGIGIGDDYVSQLFDFFSQEHIGWGRVHDGAGLGLALTKQLMVHMGGSVRVASKSGAGSVFTLSSTFETSSANLDDEAEQKRLEINAQETTRKEAGDYTPGLSKKRLLMVDDSKANRVIVHLLLAPLGVSVIGANSVTEIIAAKPDQGFDMILLDELSEAQQPLSRQIQLLKREWPNTPVLIASAKSLGSDDLSEVDGVLSKPVEQNALIKALRSVETCANDESLVEYSQAS